MTLGGRKFFSDTIQTVGGYPTIYHGLHELWTVAGGSQILPTFTFKNSTVKFILKIRIGAGATSLCLSWSFVLCSIECNKKCGAAAGRRKCSHGTHFGREPQDPQPLIKTFQFSPWLCESHCTILSAHNFVASSGEKLR